MTRFIQRRDENGVETVDEFKSDTKKDRKYICEMLAEYQRSDRFANYYISQRACKEWNN